MERRTFSKYCSFLALGPVLFPLAGGMTHLLTLPYGHDLPGVVAAHLAHFDNQMCKGAIHKNDRQLIRNCVDPVRILKLDVQGDTYRLEYVNRGGQIITLSCEAGKQKTRISNS